MPGNCSAEAPEGELVNGVGAGDSMVAGFLAGWQKSRDSSYAFRMAVAAGSASAFSDHLADVIERLMGERCPFSVYEMYGRM